MASPASMYSTVADISSWAEIAPAGVNQRSSELAVPMASLAARCGVTRPYLAQPLPFHDYLGDQFVVEALAALEPQVPLAGKLIPLGEVDAEGVDVLKEGFHVPLEEPGETAGGGLVRHGDGAGVLKQGVTQMPDDTPEQVFL